MPKSRTVGVRVPEKLWKKIHQLIESGEYNSWTDFFVTAARREIERHENAKESMKRGTEHKE